MQKDEKPIQYERNRSIQANYIYHQSDENLTFPRHLHSSFEVLALLEGKLVTRIGEREFSLSAGESIIIFPNQIHSYQSVGPSKSHLLIFSSDLVPHYSHAIEGKRYENPVIQESTLPRIEAIQAGNNAYENKGNAYLLVGEFDAACHLVEDKTGNPSILQAITSFVQEHYAEPISLKALASKSGYSYNYVSLLFNRSLGLSFPKYLNLYRIEQSAYLLSSTEESVAQIAYGCGFASLRSFNREFLALKGLTPAQFRKAHS